MAESITGLEYLGATPEISKFFEENHRASGFILARIASCVRDEYRLFTAGGEVRGEPSGTLLFGASTAADLPATGDWVAARLIAGGEAIVHAVLPRRSQFSRQAAGRRAQQQVIAANIDTAFIVCGLDHDFSPRRIERYLTLTFESGAATVIVMTKADLCEDVEARVAEARAIARDSPVLAIDARSDSCIEALSPYLRGGSTVVLLGSSGVGKSTIVNRLLGYERQATRSVREDDSRGRHTTTRRELIVLDCGALLLDTPGMRELQLWATEDSLNETFDDVTGVARECRFRNCSHQGEDGCAIDAALASGALDYERWNSYLKLRAEVRHHERMADKTAAAAEKQRWKRIHRALRSHPKYQR
jgi:ribosome biogenesis GTPase